MVEQLPSPFDELLTAREVAAYIKRSYEYVRKSDIPFIQRKRGCKKLYRRSVVDAWIGIKPPAPPPAPKKHTNRGRPPNRLTLLD